MFHLNGWCQVTGVITENFVGAPDVFPKPRRGLTPTVGS